MLGVAAALPAPEDFANFEAADDVPRSWSFGRSAWRGWRMCEVGGGGGGGWRWEVGSGRWELGDGQHVRIQWADAPG